MAKFRLGISSISVHAHRYQAGAPQLLFCPFCENVREDEIHFMLCCSTYDDLRSKLIAPKYVRNPSSFRLFVLLCRKDQTTLNNLCIFVYKALKRRSLLMS